MGAPIRTTIEIQLVLNKAQHALADLGIEIVREKKRGKTITNRDHRDKVYRLLLLRIYLQDILLPNGDILAYYLTFANEKKFNRILDGLVNLAKGFDGPAIPLLGVKNIPLLFYPGTSGNSSSSGGGPAQPGGTVFQANVDSPSTLVDTFSADISSFCFYIIGISGSNSGEGSRTSIISAGWRGSNAPGYNEYKLEDIGGITTPITFKVELVAGKIQLNAYTTTDNWTVTGVRILFQNISFVNPIGPLPAGGTTWQILAKASNLDYQTIWETLTANLITDLTASATELNFSQGVTSAIQTQLNSEMATRGAADATEASTRASADLLRVLKSGDTMSAALAMGGNKVTGLAAASAPGDAVRFEQLPTVSFVTIVIGDWNILASNLLTIAHGLADYKKIRGFKVIIRDDTDTTYQMNASGATLNYIDGPNIHLIVDSFFQTTAYDSTGFNRGWVTFELAP